MITVPHFFIRAVFFLGLAVFPLTVIAPFFCSKINSNTCNGIPMSLLFVSLLTAFFFFFSSRKRGITYRYISFSLGLFLLIFFSSIVGSVTPINVSALFILSSVIFFLPIVWLVLRTSSRRVVASAILLILGLHAQWGLVQFIFQDDLGLSYIGESSLSVDTVGVAKFMGVSGKLIRAYGPYAHPNIFAGSLVIGLSIFLYRRKFYFRSSHLFLTTPMILAIFVTFSRAALMGLVIWFFLFLYIYRDRIFSPPILRFIILFVTISLCFSPLLFYRTSDMEDLGYTDRFRGYEWSFQIIGEARYLFGTGPGQYPLALESFLDNRGIEYSEWELTSVHSVPFLLIAEYGILVGALFIIFIVYFIISRDLVLMFLPLIPLFLFDHYLLTQAAPMVLLLSVSLLCSHKRTR